MLSIKRIGRKHVCVGGVLAMALTTSACGLSFSSTETVSGVAKSAETNPCTQIDAPMVEIPADNTAEPRIRIPQPAGWEHTTELDSLAESFRFAMTAEGSQDNAVLVTLVSAPDLDAQMLFDEFEGGLEKMLDEKDLSANLTVTPGTVCGLPAQTLTRPGNDVGLGATNVAATNPMTTLQVVTEVGGDTYVVSVITTAEPDHPQYPRDVEVILSGLQVLPPTVITA